MASRHIETYCQDLLFPVGALILSEGIDRLVRAGRLDPIPYFRRHVRGDWGDVSDGQWQANGIALQSGALLESHYVIHRGLRHSHRHRCETPSHIHRAAVRRLSTFHQQAASACIFHPPSAVCRLIFPPWGRPLPLWGWCMPHFLWSITMSLDLENTTAEATPVQGELLDAESNPSDPEPSGFCRRVRRRTARRPQQRQSAGLYRPAAGASSTRRRQPQTQAIPSPGRSRPCRRRAADRPWRTRRDRQRRDGLRQNDRWYRHSRRAQRRRLSPYPGSFSTAPGLQVAAARSRRRWQAPRSGCSTARTRWSSSSSCASSWVCSPRARSSLSWGASGCGWDSTGSLSSPRGAPAMATWQRALTAARSSPTSTASRSTRSRSKPRSTAGSAAIAPRPCGH